MFRAPDGSAPEGDRPGIPPLRLGDEEEEKEEAPEPQRPSRRQDPALRALKRRLWTQIDQIRATSDVETAAGRRSLLARELALLGGTALRTADVWRIGAAGQLALDNPGAALRWFERGWREQPADALWLADYADALEQVAGTGPARRLRLRALRALRPMAVQAAHRGPSPWEREVLRTYVLLARQELGPREGLGWLREVLQRDLDPAVSRELWRLWQHPDEGDRAYQRGMLLRLHGPAQASGGDDAMSSAATNAGEEEDDEDEDEDDEDDEGELNATADVAEADETGEARPDRAAALTLGSDVHGLGALLVGSGLVRGDLTRGRLGLGLHAGYAYLSDGANRLAPQSDPLRWGEVDVGGQARWQGERGKLDVGVGGNLRAAQSLAYGTLRGDYEFFPGLVTALDVGLNLVVEDTSGLRLLGTRDRVALGAAWDLTRREFIDFEANWHRYLDRERDPLSDGYSVYAEAGHRLLLGGPGWNVRVSGYWEDNFLVPALPAGITMLLAQQQTPVSALVVPRFGMVGAGTSVRRGLPGVPRGDGRLRCFADAWLGYLWPLNTVGYDLQAGLGLPLGRAGDLSVSGYFSNSRLGGGVDGLSWGAGLRYVY